MVNDGIDFTLEENPIAQDILKAKFNSPISSIPFNSEPRIKRKLSMPVHTFNTPTAMVTFPRMIFVHGLCNFEHLLVLTTLMEDKETRCDGIAGAYFMQESSAECSVTLKQH